MKWNCIDLVILTSQLFNVCPTDPVAIVFEKLEANWKLDTNLTLATFRFHFIFVNVRLKSRKRKDNVCGIRCMNRFGSLTENYNRTKSQR